MSNTHKIERQNKNLTVVRVIPGVFTAEECDKILSLKDDWPMQLGTTGSDIMNKIRYRETNVYRPEAPIDWINQRIFRTAVECNRSAWEFDVLGMAETPGVMEYKEDTLTESGVPGHYDWHMDIGGLTKFGPIRKISFSVLLNEGYTGGDLELFGINTKATSDRPKGTMIMFPSYLQHRVTPMIKGVRYALVGWMHGNSF